jgi:hypothetical protein
MAEYLKLVLGGKLGSDRFGIFDSKAESFLQSKGHTEQGEQCNI